MSRPGTVITLENNSPPMMFNAGDGFHYEKLPEGTRVIYPPGPVQPLADPNVAIERALLTPMGMEPLHDLLFPGMRLTIAFDDLSLPLPPMQRPDIRQLIIEKVLEKAYAKGVEDVHLIAALGLHRRMTEAELRHCLGKKIMNRFYPDRLYNYDAEDEEGNVKIGDTVHGEDVTVSRRVAESDLLVYVNVNYIPMDGGHKSVHTGLSPYSSIRHHHTPDTLSNTRSLMDPPNSAMHGSINRMGELFDEHVKVFHIETTLNNSAFPPVFDFMAKPEHEWGAVTKANFLANHRATSVAPRGVSRRIFQSIKAPHRMTSVQAGATEPVHAETLRNNYEQMVVPVEGQADVLLLGIPYLGPYNVNSIMNPLLVYNMLLGYLFNLYRGKPLVREGGVVIGTHPMPADFNEVHHPSYVDLWNEGFAETHDIRELHHRYEERYANDPWYRTLYRNSYAYHGAHPFTVLYWAAHALDHVGDTILVGGDPMTTKRMGLKRADSIAEALEMTKDTVGPSPSTTYMHIPPLFMCEVS
ncbi:MAG: nickel-dependent lactate racemase [Actinobacteria bacterium]|nr:nickel-dependent lactate racemase [Actinomycetota bacterium]